MVLLILLIIYNIVCPICLTLHLCVPCVKATLKSPAHLFLHCSFASHFWHIILEAFGWSLACLNNMFDILASLLVGHSFHGTKKMV